MEQLIGYLMERAAALERQQQAIQPAVIAALQTIAQYNQISAALDEINAALTQAQKDAVIE